MRQRIKSAVLVFCMMTLAVNVIAADIDIDYTQVAEDMEIMSALIDRILEDKFPDEYSSASLFRGFRGCQGIYLKGYGPVFITNIGFPVAERAELQAEVSPDDMWQRMKYELKGTSTRATGYAYGHLGAGGNYSREKVEGLKEQLLELIGTYGTNIRHLDSQESVTIAVRGTTSSPESIWVSDVGTVRMKTGESGEYIVDLKKKEAEIKEKVEELQKKTEDLQKKGEELQEKAEELQKEAEILPKLELHTQTEKLNGGTMKHQIMVIPSTGKGVGIIGSARGYTTMIVKASKADIMAFKNGELDSGEFMERAEIIQY